MFPGTNLPLIPHDHGAMRRLSHNAPPAESTIFHSPASPTMAQRRVVDTLERLGEAVTQRGACLLGDFSQNWIWFWERRDENLLAVVYGGREGWGPFRGWSAFEAGRQRKCRRAHWTTRLTVEGG